MHFVYTSTPSQPLRGRKLPPVYFFLCIYTKHESMGVCCEKGLLASGEGCDRENDVLSVSHVCVVGAGGGELNSILILKTRNQ